MKEVIDDLSEEQDLGWRKVGDRYYHPSEPYMIVIEEKDGQFKWKIMVHAGIAVLTPSFGSTQTLEGAKEQSLNKMKALRAERGE